MGWLGVLEGGLGMGKLGFKGGGGGGSAYIMGDGMAEEGCCGVSGAFTQNGGVLSGMGTGANDSRGGREKGEPMAFSSASENSDGASMSMWLCTFSFLIKLGIEASRSLGSWNIIDCACLLASAKKNIYLENMF